MSCPPIINISSLFPASTNAFSRLSKTNIFLSFKLLDKITFFLPGSAFPIESYVILPIIIVLPIVIFLKFFRSSDKCQGIPLSFPITLFLDIATIIDIFIILLFLH